MLWWAEKGIKSLKNIARPKEYGWKTFVELRLEYTRIRLPLYARVIIPYDFRPMPPPSTCQ